MEANLIILMSTLREMTMNQVEISKIEDYFLLIGG